MRKIIAIGGEPATGKSTIIQTFITGKFSWIEREDVKLVPTLYNEECNIHILGRYPPGEKFGGTDRYSMAVQPQAIKFVQNTNANILFEGDRLFNHSFLEFLADLPLTDLRIIYLKVSDQIIAQRHKDREDSQSETFKKGRKTKIENLQSNMNLMPYMETFINETVDDQVKILNVISSDLYIR